MQHKVSWCWKIFYQLYPVWLCPTNSIWPSPLSAHFEILAAPLAALHPKCPLTTHSRSSLVSVFIASTNLNLQSPFSSNLASLRLHSMAYQVTYLLIKQHYLALSTWLPAYLRQLFWSRPVTLPMQRQLKETRPTEIKPYTGCWEKGLFCYLCPSSTQVI